MEKSIRQANSNILMKEEEGLEDSEYLLQSHNTMLLKCKDTILELNEKLQNEKNRADEASQKVIQFEELMHTSKLGESKKDRKITLLCKKLEEVELTNASLRNSVEDNMESRRISTEGYEQVKNQLKASEMKSAELEEKIKYICQ